MKTLNLRAAKISTNGKTLKFRAAKLKGFTVYIEKASFGSKWSFFSGSSRTGMSEMQARSGERVNDKLAQNSLALMARK